MGLPRILILSFSPIVTDARVLKQVALLRDRYEVYSCGHGPAPEGVSGHIEIPSELAVWRYDRALLMTRQYGRAYWSNAAIANAKEQLQGREFDVVLANDVDAVGLALSLQPEHGVHADLHEYAPRQKEELTRWRLFVAPFVRWMCRTFVARADSVTTVGQGIADEYKRVFSVDAEVVTNAAPYADVSPTTVGDPIRLVHSGACLRNRNLMVMIEGVALSRANVSLDFYLTPNDPLYLAELQSHVVGLPNVRVNDPVPYDVLIGTLNAFDVGVFVLPPVNFNYEWALPNKLFDYVQARLGVVVGPSAEMSAYVRDFGLGEVAADYTAGAFARVLDSLTLEQVQGFKRASDTAARDLSAESQVTIWGAAIARLVEANASSA